MCKREFMRSTFLGCLKCKAVWSWGFLWGKKEEMEIWLWRWNIDGVFRVGSDLKATSTTTSGALSKHWGQSLRAFRSCLTWYQFLETTAEAFTPTQECLRDSYPACYWLNKRLPIPRKLLYLSLLAFCLSSIPFFKFRLEHKSWFPEHGHNVICREMCKWVSDSGTGKEIWAKLMNVLNLNLESLHVSKPIMVDTTSHSNRKLATWTTNEEALSRLPLMKFDEFEVAF